MTTKAKRMGRPKKAPEPGTRMSLGLKVTADVKRRLDEAAEKSGRTQSQEAEFRLQRSFSEEDALFGPEMRDIARMMTVAFFSELSAAAKGKGHSQRNPAEWLKDEDCYIPAAFNVLSTLLAEAPVLTQEKIMTWATEIRDQVVQKAFENGRIKLEP